MTVLLAGDLSSLRWLCRRRVSRVTDSICTKPVSVYTKSQSQCTKTVLYGKRRAEGNSSSTRKCALSAPPPIPPTSSPSFLHEVFYSVKDHCVLRWDGSFGWSVHFTVMVCFVRSPRAHLHMVGMLRFMSLTKTKNKTNRACPILSSLFLCLFPSLWPFQLYFIPQIFPTFPRFLTLFFRSYLCVIGPFNCIPLYESLHQP